jgi:leucyl/phenylalanyl-tRNA--protein transferase
MSHRNILTAEQLLYGYANGVFPMAEGKYGRIYWYAPDPRAIIPFYTYKPQKSLRPIINQKKFDIHFDTRFEQVMRHCAAPRTDDNNTWISEEIIRAYTQLHQMGYAHSVEAFENGELVGGLYGVALGGAFFGESMFYLRPNASKVAFYYLIEQLKQQQFELLDTQFINDNVQRYGAVEIPREDYMLLLEQALLKKVTFL